MKKLSLPVLGVILIAVVVLILLLRQESYIPVTGVIPSTFGTNVARQYPTTLSNCDREAKARNDTAWSLKIGQGGNGSCTYRKYATNPVGSNRVITQTTPTTYSACTDDAKTFPDCVSKAPYVNGVAQAEPIPGTSYTKIGMIITPDSQYPKATTLEACKALASVKHYNTWWPDSWTWYTATNKCLVTDWYQNPAGDQAKLQFTDGSAISGCKDETKLYPNCV